MATNIFGIQAGLPRAIAAGMITYSNLTAQRVKELNGRTGTQVSVAPSGDKLRDQILNTKQLADKFLQQNTELYTEIGKVLETQGLLSEASSGTINFKGLNIDYAFTPEVSKIDNAFFDVGTGGSTVGFTRTKTAETLNLSLADTQSLLDLYYAPPAPIGQSASSQITPDKISFTNTRFV